MLIRYLKDLTLWVFEFLAVRKSLINFDTKFQPVFISASDSSHEKSLLQFVDSVLLHEPSGILYIFDLGLTEKTKNKLLDIQKNYKSQFQIRKFNFHNLPRWMNVKNANRGEWAWKSLIISSVREELFNSNLFKDGILIWNDAGNKLIASTQKLCYYTKSYGFYSPSSDGNIEKWCHIGQIKAIKGSNKFLKKPMLNGALLAFNLNSRKANILIDSWTKSSLNRNVIAPLGSNRGNHRQDQSLITLIAYKIGIAPSKRVLSLTNHSVLIHQDIEKYF